MKLRDKVSEIPIPLHQILGEMEKRLIERAMTNSLNNQSLAARLLGISRSTLIKKIKEYAKSN
jgi:DNA-binding protein Fis